ncbi:MAG: hypothetical protein AAGE01_23650 [Pseudomonadota bacterium]
MTTKKKATALSTAEAAVCADRDLIKELVRESPQQILEGEITELLGAAPGERNL